jgi:hypothetical protein
LEWWTGVLKNATRNDIDEKFWKDCGHLISLPDLRSTRSNFEIVGDKIVAPTSLLHGIGPKAHDALFALGPYKDVFDFSQKICDWRLANGTKTEKVDKKTNQPRVATKLAASPINRTAIFNLVVAGAMDKLFPPTADTVVEKLRLYEEAQDVVYAESHAKFASGKRKLGDKVAFGRELVADQMFEFQTRKTVLPAWTEPLGPMMLQRQEPGVFSDAGQLKYETKSGKILPIVSGEQLLRLEAETLLPEGGLEYWVPAFVISSRKWQYGQPGGPKDKEAEELVLDVDGIRFKFIKWPNRTGDRIGKLPVDWPQDLSGSICLVQIVRWSADKAGSIEKVIVVRAPLVPGSGEQPPEKEEPNGTA